MNEFEIKKRQLLPYLQNYLSKKNLRMRIVLIGIVNQLRNNKRITEKQFTSLIKFLERETPFLRMTRDEIIHYFRPIIIQQNKKDEFYGNTLCKFFV